MNLISSTDTLQRIHVVQSTIVSEFDVINHLHGGQRPCFKARLRTSRKGLTNLNTFSLTEHLCGSAFGIGQSNTNRNDSKKSGQRNPGWDLATTHRTTLDLLRQRTKRPRKEASRRNVCKTGAQMRGNTRQADPACKQSRAYPSREETCRGQHSVHEVEGAVTQPAVDIIPEHSEGHKEANCLLLQITATNSTTE